MDGRRISLTIFLICTGMLTAQSQAHGFWNNPGTFAQYLGYGTGAGLHAPLGCQQNCQQGCQQNGPQSYNFIHRQHPPVVQNCTNCGPHRQQNFQPRQPAPMAIPRNHGSANHVQRPVVNMPIQSYPAQPAPPRAAPQPLFSPPAKRLPKPNLPTPAPNKAPLLEPIMPMPGPTN